MVRKLLSRAELAPAREKIAPLRNQVIRRSSVVDLLAHGAKTSSTYASANSPVNLSVVNSVVIESGCSATYSRQKQTRPPRAVQRLAQRRSQRTRPRFHPWCLRAG